MRREGKVNGGKRNRPGHIGLCRRGPPGVREWDATSVPQSGSQVQQPGQGNSSWRSCRLPQPEGGCFASKTCKSSCRSCWPAETDRAPVAGRGCGAEGSLSSKVSEQPDPLADFLHHTLASLAEAFPPPARGCSLPPGTPCPPRSHFLQSQHKERMCSVWSMTRWLGDFALLWKLVANF